MNNFVVIPENFDPDQDYWSFNPQHKMIPLFKKVKRKFGHKISSQIMWTAVFLGYPDKSVNKLFRLPVEKRKEIIGQYYEDVDFTEPLIEEVLAYWPKIALSVEERALKAELEFLHRRGEFLKTVPYTLDTMAQIDSAVSKTNKIYENFMAVREKFDEASAKKKTMVYGGRQKTFTEQKKM